MTQRRPSRAIRPLGVAVVTGFSCLGIAELALRLDNPLVLLFWLPTLWGGAFLVFLGVFRLAGRPQLALLLVVAGALLGCLASAWTLIMPVLAVTLVAIVLASEVRQDQPTVP